MELLFSAQHYRMSFWNSIKISFNLNTTTTTRPVDSATFKWLELFMFIFTMSVFYWVLLLFGGNGIPQSTWL